MRHSVRWKPLQQVGGRREYLHGLQLAHAPVVERTHPPLARSTRHLALQMYRLRMIRLGPGNVSRAKQGDDRPVESHAKMPRSAIGGHQQMAATHASLGQPQRQGMVAQGVDGGVASLQRDPSSQLRSAGPHSTSTPHPRSIASFRANSANDSAGQYLAEPKAAPGLRQTTSE